MIRWTFGFLRAHSGACGRGQLDGPQRPDAGI